MPLKTPRENSTENKSPKTHFQPTHVSFNNVDLSQEYAPRTISLPSPNSKLLLTITTSKPNIRQRTQEGRQL